MSLISLRLSHPQFSTEHYANGFSSDYTITDVFQEIEFNCEISLLLRTPVVMIARLSA